jgi:hypothetical protein
VDACGKDIRESPADLRQLLLRPRLREFYTQVGCIIVTNILQALKISHFSLISVDDGLQGGQWVKIDKIIVHRLLTIYKMKPLQYGVIHLSRPH